MTELQTALAQLNEKVTSKMATHTTKIDQLQDEITDLAQKSGGSHAIHNRKANKSLGSTFTNSDGFKAFRDSGSTNTGVITADLQFKALTSLQGSPETVPVGVDVAATRQSGLVAPTFKPTRLYELLSSTPVSSNSFSFTRVSGFNNAANYQAGEGTGKAEQTLPVENVLSPIATIAVHHTSSKQVLADEIGLSAAIDTILRGGIVEKAEAELMNGSGGDNISGLLYEATPFTPTLTTSPEKIGECISSMQGAGYMPNAICMNPADWFAIRSERATGGEYVANGWVSGENQSIYDVPVLITPSLASGNAVVLDSRYVTILDREAPSVLMSSEHGNNFTNNLVTALAELRIGLAVYDQAAVRELSLA